MTSKVGMMLTDPHWLVEGLPSNSHMPFNQMVLLRSHDKIIPQNYIFTPARLMATNLARVLTTGGLTRKRPSRHQLLVYNETFKKLHYTLGNSKF